MRGYFWTGRDVSTFDRSIKDSKKSINKLHLQKRLSKNEFSTLNDILESIESFDLAFFNYYLAIREAGRVLNDLGYKNRTQ